MRLIRENKLQALLMALLVLSVVFGPVGVALWGVDSREVREVLAKPPPPPKPAAKLAVIWNLPVSSAADILTTSITVPVSPVPTQAHRMTVGLLGTASIVDVVIDDGTETHTFSLNDGTALTAGVAYSFSWGATGWTHQDGATSLTYNLQCKTGTTIGILQIDAIKDGGL